MESESKKQGDALMQENEPNFEKHIDDIVKAIGDKLERNVIANELRRYVDEYGIDLATAKESIVRKHYGNPNELSIGGEKLLAHFFVGKNTPDFFNAYIRQQGSEKVYIASDLSKSNFDKGTRTWRNRKIFSFNKGDITNVLIELANEVTEMKSGDDNKWQMIQPATSAVKQNTLDTILDNISKFETDDFVSDDSDSSFEAKEKITVTLNDGSKRILLAATEVDGKHWVKRFDQEQLFSIYKYKYNQLKTHTIS